LAVLVWIFELEFPNNRERVKITIIGTTVPKETKRVETDVMVLVV
jgi:hypothetical protein